MKYFNWFYLGIAICISLFAILEDFSLGLFFALFFLGLYFSGFMFYAGYKSFASRNKPVNIDVHQILKNAVEKKRLEFLQLPIKHESINHVSPTLKQLDYAKKLGIDVPEDASKDDVSVMISRIVDDNDYLAPNIGLAEYASNKNIHFSRFVGKKQLYNIVFYSLSDEDKLAFFVFSLYRWLSGDRHANLDTFKDKHLIYQFASEMISDKSFVTSVKKYEGEALRIFGEVTTPDDQVVAGGSTGTIAYKKSAVFLKETFNTPMVRTKF